MSNSEQHTSETFGLGERIFRGGLLLAARQVLSIVVSVLGFLFLIRFLGPTEYGRYTAAFGINAFTAATAQLGIGVFLVRGAKDPDALTFNIASTFLFVTGVVAAIVELIVATNAGTLIGLGQAMPILAFLALGLPVNLLTIPVQARFERKLDYLRIAVVELTVQLIFYAVSLPLALSGYGAWSLATGLIVQQVLECVLYHVLARWVPRPAWRWSILKDMLRYSIGFSLSSAIWTARGLVNSVIVGSLLGVEAVAFVALAARVIDMLAFVKNATWRLSIAALSKIENDPARLLRALDQGMVLQVLALGPFLVLFALLGRDIVTLALGGRWLPILTLYPFIAVSTLTNAVFSMHSYVLYIFRRNLDVAIFNAIHVSVFAAAAWLLLSSFGIIGYGYAELCAIPTYVALDILLRRRLGSPSYAMVLSWYVPIAAAILLHAFAWWTACVVLVPLAWQRNRTTVILFIRRSRSVMQFDQIT